MSQSICVSCAKPKAKYQCGICASDLCKSCAQFLDDTVLNLVAQLPPDLMHASYCWSCFCERVAPQLEECHSLVDRAKDVDIFTKRQSKESQRIKREKPTLTVYDCHDREESLLRLATMAAQEGCNGLVDVDVVAKKIKTSGYSTTVWSASGIPVHIENRHIIPNLSFSKNPN